MFMILIRDGDSWAEAATAETLETALAVAATSAQIEEWDDGQSVIIRPGTATE